MSDCSNSSCKPYKRVEVRVVFEDERELEYLLPINLMNRRIDHFDVDGERFTRQQQRTHEESWEWLSD
jgi:hypothetical protein